MKRTSRMAQAKKEEKERMDLHIERCKEYAEAQHVAEFLIRHGIRVPLRPGEKNLPGRLDATSVVTKIVIHLEQGADHEVEVKRVAMEHKTVSGGYVCTVHPQARHLAAIKDMLEHSYVGYIVEDANVLTED
jgi:hypothetical protein